MAKMAWPGGEHEFAFGLDEFSELQSLCGCGAGGILQRLVSECQPADVRHTLRLGLVGGGINKEEAATLVNRKMLKVGIGNLAAYAASALAANLYRGKEDAKWGEEDTFALSLDQLEQLQSNCDAGPGRVLSRLIALECRVEDVKNTIRLGLIGGGMVHAKANARFNAAEREHGLGNLTEVAIRILTDALYVPEDDPLPPGKPQTESQPETGSGGSPKSTEPPH